MRPNGVKFAEHVRQHYHATPEAHHTKDDVLKYEYWKHYSRNFKPGDKVDLHWQDNSCYAEVVILHADQFGAKVYYVLGPVQMDNGAQEKTPESSGEYAYEWAGPSHKYRIIRISDSEVVAKGLETKEAANQEIANLLKAL